MMLPIANMIVGFSILSATTGANKVASLPKVFVIVKASPVARVGKL